MPTEPDLDVDCLAAGLLGGLARELVEGRERDLLAPLRFLSPGALPDGPAPRVDRAGLARGLELANSSYGHPAARELAAKLADPATRVVATGQQTGLLGGPLLGYVKAAAAVRWAEALEARGEPAVAIFWMATEDHDFDEVAGAGFPAADGLRRLDLGADPQPLAPVGMRTVGAAIGPVLAELEELFPSPWARAALERLAGWWRPEARFGEAFARQMAAAFGSRAPLLVDSQLPELKRAERPHLARLVERRAALAAELERREAELIGRGRTPQVAPQPGASPLFLVRGGERRRIEWRGGSEYALRGAAASAPVEELLAAIEENPAVVSPGALARPAIQDAVFGTLLQVMGPGELAYLPQAAAAYTILGLEAPWTSLRPSAVVVGKKERERLAALELPLAELLADPEDAARRLGERRDGGFVEPARSEILGRIDALGEPARAVDPQLERAHRKTLRTVERALGRFAGKVAAAALRRDELASDRFHRVVSRLAPGGQMQERVVAYAYFVLRCGDEVGESLLNSLDLDPRRLSVVAVEEAGAAR